MSNHDDDLSQDDRIGVLSTPLDMQTRRGRDMLALVRFDGTEGLSELFEYRVEALSHIEDIDFNKALGQQCTIVINTFAGEKRDFHGILVEAQWLGKRDDKFSYRIVLRPWLWLLTRTTDCRIFLDKTAPQIISEVFKDRGFTDFESRLEEEGSFPEREYCVQFRETDFNFVCRLMEKEGIYYYFKHENGKHTLVLANAKSSHDPVFTMQKAGQGQALSPLKEMPFLPPVGNFVPTNQRFEHWVAARQFRSGIVELNDYNYEKPNAQMTCIEMGDKAYDHGDMEIYEYPGNYKEEDVGQRYAEIALQAEQTRDHRRQASGDAVSLFPGGLTTLKGHPTASQNLEYLIVRAVHSFGEQTYRSQTQEKTEGFYHGHYEMQPSARPFRAPIVTPVPRIYGIQTAKVVTKEEGKTEEIEVEKLSEIYVRFYWDRRQHKEKRSCKLRCAQVWAGKKWGGQFIPRVGMEVVVQFIDGDPDRPIVTGCVYNDENQPPYDLPAKKTISGIKSDSTKGDQGYNSWNFEDKKGSEQINVHAQKDLNTVVLSNETRSTGNDLDTTVTHAETRTIGEKFEVPVGSASRQTTLKMGDDKLDVETGNILHTACLKIELKVGPSTVTVEPWGITLDAPTITLKAAGPITVNGLPVLIN